MAAEGNDWRWKNLFHWSSSISSFRSSQDRRQGNSLGTSMTNNSLIDDGLTTGEPQACANQRLNPVGHRAH